MADEKEEAKSGLEENVNLSKIQAVKELIFGEEIQDYGQQFRDISSELESIRDLILENKNENDRLREELEKATESSMQKMETKLLEKIQKLQDTKTDRAKLGKMLVQIGEKLQA